MDICILYITYLLITNLFLFLILCYLPKNVYFCYFPEAETCHSFLLFPSSNQSDTSSVHPLNCWMRLVGLYTCPQVKFYWNILAYFGFLFLFALVLITDFQSTPSWKELLLYVWLASLMLEEVRQVRKIQFNANNHLKCISCCTFQQDNALCTM